MGPPGRVPAVWSLPSRSRTKLGMVSLPCSRSASQPFRCRRKISTRIWSGTNRLKSGASGGKVAHQFRLGGHVRGDQRDGPGPLVHAAAPLGGHRLARRNGLARAVAALQHRPHAADSATRLVHCKRWWRCTRRSGNRSCRARPDCPTDSRWPARSRRESSAAADSPPPPRPRSRRFAGSPR